MVQVSQGTPRFSCTFSATLIAGLLVSAVALVGSDTEALIFEMQSKSGDGFVKLEVMITPGSDFRMSSTVDRVKWTLYGSVESVADGVATVSVTIKRGNSVVRQLADGKFNIDSLDNFGWAGVWGGSEISRYWIRKGVDSVPVVNRILARRDKSFGTAASYLTELEPEAQSAALPQLIAALNDGIDNSKRPPYDTLRASAAKSLGKFGATAKAAVPALVQRLKDENGYIRVDAAAALWRIEQHPAAVPALIAELKNEAWNIRSRAVSNLGDITATENSSVTIPALIGTFENDENENVRRQAAYALATTGDLAKSAVPALTSALDDESEEIRRAASHAIEVIFGRTAAPPWRHAYARATYYSRNEEWEKALQWWQAYIPQQLRVDVWPSLKYERIAQSQLRLGKRGDASVTILENVEVAPYWILELVDAFRLHNELPGLEQYADDLLLAEDVLPEGPEVAKRAKIAHEYIRMVRMAESGDAASLWAMIELPSWDTAIDPFDPLDFDFDRSRRAQKLLLSMQKQAKPLLLSKLKQTPADKADPQSQPRREQRMATILLGRLKATEILPFIRSEFKNELDQNCASDYFYAALSLGTDEAVAFVNDFATKPEHRAYRATARKVLDYFSAKQVREQREDGKVTETSP